MLPLLIDENFNHRILRGLRRAVPHLDHVVAQNIELRGSLDPHMLAWAANHDRILVTHDLKTIPKHAYDRVKAGQAMPRVVAVPDSLSIRQAIEELALITECVGPAEL